MSYPSLLLHLLLLFPSLHSSTLTPSPCPSPSTTSPFNFTLYVLSLHWPFTVCLTNSTSGLPLQTSSCFPPPPTFTINHFYPVSLSPTPHSPTCCPAQFSLAPILDIAPALSRIWPDLSPSNDAVALWKSQWLTHGACSGLPLRTYFKNVLTLTHRYDFLRALNAAGIVIAGRRRGYPAQQLQTALDYATGGFKVKLRCRRTTQQIDQPVYLEAIQICLGRTRLETINCPSLCLKGDVGCCQDDDQITIPYWGNHDSDIDGHHLGSPSNGPAHLWIRQIAGAIVIAAGVAFWVFKQFWERDDQRPSRSQYLRMW